MKPIHICPHVLEQARLFFEDRGAEGSEATAMIACGTDSVAHRLVIPTQRAGRAPDSWVEVPRQGKLELAVALGTDERYVARIHSHPALAFHSATDDRNPALTHQGALSMVVPFFGLGLRRGLEACAVYVLEGNRWIELPSGPEREQWVVVL